MIIPFCDRLQKILELSVALIVTGQVILELHFGFPERGTDQ